MGNARRLLSRGGCGIWWKTETMTSFTLAQLQRVADIYRQYLRVCHVRVRITKDWVGYGWTCHARASVPKLSVHAEMLGGKMIFRRPQRAIKIRPSVLRLDRRSQISLIVHELLHFYRGGLNHSRRFRSKAELWSRKTVCGF